MSKRILVLVLTLVFIISTFSTLAYAEKVKIG
jgi:hypothetical protein